MKKNISFEEALGILQGMQIEPIGSEKIIFSEALGRTLAKDVVAKYDMPAFETSSMDGYAFRYEDLNVLQTQGLTLLGDNPAGEQKDFILSKNSALKTFTGSKMPQNSDTLVIVESIFEKDGKIFLNPQATPPKKGDWVRKRAENYASGENLLHKGSKIGAYEIGLLADLNEVFVEVFIKPKVAILSGGNEIIEVGEETQNKNSIRSVNNHLLKAMVTLIGGEAILYPMMPDDKDTINQMIEQALLHCDVLLTTGGMSMGDYDFTQEAIQDLCNVHFKGVRMKPGKPVMYATYQNSKKHIFGLPGFPNSAAITFYLFGSIVFAKMFARDYKHQILKAVLKENILRVDSRKEFRVCDLNVKNGRYEASFSSKRVLQSSVINNLCGECGLAILEENGENLVAGSEVPILLFKKFL